MQKARIQKVLSIIAMVVLIVLAAVIANTISLKKEKNALTDLFETQEYDGNTIDSRVNEIRNQAANLCGAAVSYVGSTDSEYSAVQEDMDVLAKAKSVSDKYYAMTSLCTSSVVLARKATTAIGDSTNEDYKDIIRAQAVIENISYLLEEFSTEYNTAVRDFNDSKNSFPKVLISFLVSDAEEFK